ncbi:response regulator [Bacillus solimangrovi]|uniref:Response regulatory domain-containing protein n=1 Tax=Bacillus solimangrovi TaxID=1305675 RepID=A0A1E5LFH0_9BACI|nr:response regulator [Bacillus solimangrovi]OEH92806.1 hypothetical protein BFG57_02090 [Bacillus solimangrovi]
MHILLIHAISAERRNLIDLLKSHKNTKQITKFKSIESANGYLLKVTNDTSIPDVILVDNFNNSNKVLKLCSNMRKQTWLKYIPVLLLSDTSHMSFLERAINHGVTDYINKPVHPTEVLNRISLSVKLKIESEENRRREKELAYMFKSIHEDVELARQIQSGILPNEITDNNIQISALFQPSEQLSGDMYYWVKINDHQYAIILIDIVGHGIHAALVSMSFRSLLHGLLTRVVDPILVIEELNDHIHQLFKQQNRTRLLNYYFTALYAVIDTAEQTIEYVNAGHPDGLFITEQQDLLLMNEGCPPIGLIPNMVVKKEKIAYHSQTKLLFFTDGLIEISNQKLWTDRLISHLKQSFYLDNEKLLNRIIDSRNNESIQNDDICIIAINLKP